ncbi:MAG: DUF1294 domain-containing protein [Massilia sp.]
MPLLPLYFLCAWLAYATMQLALSPLVPLVYAVMSVLCFALTARDKAAARAGRRRTPESTLLWTGLACGWPGGLLAQQLLRHKTSKPAFRLPFWGTALLNAGLLAWLSLRA